MAPGNITPILVPMLCAVAGPSVALSHWRLKPAFWPLTTVALPGDGYGREPREAAVDDVAQVTLAVLSVEVVRASQDLQGGAADRVVAGFTR